MVRGRVLGFRLRVLAALIATAHGASHCLGDPASARSLIEGYLATSTIAEPLEALVEKLGHDEHAVRERATRHLIALGDEARPLVERAAKSHDPEVRLRARRILAAHQPSPTDVHAALTEAIDALAAAKERWVLQAMIQLLHHRRVDVRYAAEYGLRRVARRAFHYNAYAARADRAAAVGRWRAWWTRSAAGFAFEAERRPAPEPAGILVCGGQTSKVWLYKPSGKLVWTKQLRGATFKAIGLSNGNTIHADSYRKVVEETTPEGRVVWSTKGIDLAGTVTGIERLPNGNTLIAHLGGRRAVEVDAEPKIVWTYRAEGLVYGAQRLASGNTLVCMHVPCKVVEVTRAGRIVWQKADLGVPFDAVKLPNGNVLIAEHSKQRVIEVNRQGAVVWERRCRAGPRSVRRLPDGTTAIGVYGRGFILVDKDGMLVRELHRHDIPGGLSIFPRVRASDG